MPENSLLNFVRTNSSVRNIEIKAFADVTISDVLESLFVKVKRFKVWFCSFSIVCMSLLILEAPAAVFHASKLMKNHSKMIMRTY